MTLVWGWAGALAVALALGLGGCARSSDGAPAVRNAAEYQRTLDEVRASTRDRLVAYDEGQAMDDDARAELAEAEARVRRLAEFDPTNPATQVLLGKLNLAIGDSPMAEERFAQAVALLPDAPTADVDRALSSEAHGGLARAAENRREWEAAAERATRALEWSPGDPRWRSIRASAFIQLRRLDEAREDLDVAQASEPDFPRARALRMLVNSATADPGGKGDAP